MPCRPYAHLPTMRTPEGGRTDVPLGPNPLQHRAYFAMKVDTP
jgi:hypothetical protein